jgi:hypothetical protein
MNVYSVNNYNQVLGEIPGAINILGPFADGDKFRCRIVFPKESICGYGNSPDKALLDGIERAKNVRP